MREVNFKMINYNSLKKAGRRSLALVGSFGLAGLLGGCDDTPGDITLYETTIQGPVRVKLVQEVQSDFFLNYSGMLDDYRLEVYDALGKKRINFVSQDDLKWGTKIVSDDGTSYVVNNGKRYIEKTDEVSQENK